MGCASSAPTADASPAASSIPDQLIAAGYRGDLELVQRLVRDGANVNQTNRVSLLAQGALLFAGSRVAMDCLTRSAYAQLGESVLERAAVMGHVSCVKFLLSQGASITSKNIVGKTPVDYASPAIKAILLASSGPASGQAFIEAAMASPEEKKLDKLKELLAAGVDINTRDAVHNVGYTALHWAAARGPASCVRLLLDKGALMNLKDKDGDTPLHRAVVNSRMDCVQLLVERGADKTAKRNDGKSPLDLAGGEGEIAVKLRGALGALSVAEKAAAERAASAAAAAGKKAAAEKAAATAAAAAAAAAAEEKAAAEKAAASRLAAEQNFARIQAEKAAVAKVAEETARRLAEEAAAHKSVPAELAAWLAPLELSGHGPRLVGEPHRLRFVSDCRFLDEADLVGCGMSKVEAKRFIAAAAKLAGTTQRLAPVPAHARPRATVRALVIGINAYLPATEPPKPGSGPGALDNAVADARAVHAALSSLPGAASTLLTDCTKAQMEQALRDFRDSRGVCKDRGMRVSAAAGPEAEAVRTLGVIFFAGHGLQLSKANYLVPSDWRVPTLNEEVKVMEGDAADACLSLDTVEKTLAQTSMTAGTVLLDCCRNVPDFLGMMQGLKSRVVGGARSLPSGMSDATPRLRDLMVMFATAPGAVALDRSSRLQDHSPFTAALLKALAVPQLRLLDLTPMLTDEVSSDSGGKQRPHVGGSYGREAGDLVLL